MSKSPYEILGLSENASMDEVKKAYRKKARENHPDLHPNDPNAVSRMNEINEAYDRIVNPEKYAKERAKGASGSSPYSGSGGYGAGGYGGGSSGGYGGSGYGSGSGGAGRGTAQGPQGEGYVWVNGFGFDMDDLFGMGATGGTPRPEASVHDTADVRQAIDYINAKNYAAAIGIMNAIPSTGRNARWYYLSSLANHGAGNTVMAHDQIRKARQMDPENGDYARAQRNFQATGASYQQTSQEQGYSTWFANPSTICCACCAMQMWMPFCCI